jgi:hypothetical protein
MNRIKSRTNWQAPYDPQPEQSRESTGHNAMSGSRNWDKSYVFGPITNLEGRKAPGLQPGAQRKLRMAMA